MSLLTICQDAADLIGMARPSAITSGTDAIARQLGVLARQSLSFLANEFDWNELVAEGTITLVSGTQSYSMASDFLRMVHSTTWDRTDQQEQEIPTTPQEWAYMKGEGINTSLGRRARLIAGKMEFFDTIDASSSGNLIKYEYISSNLAKNASGTAQANLTSDTYLPRMNDLPVILGVVWRYKQQKGLEWQKDYDTYRRECQKYMGWNRAPSFLCLDGQSYLAPIGVSVKDRGYG